MFRLRALSKLTVNAEHIEAQVCGDQNLHLSGSIPLESYGGVEGADIQAHFEFLGCMKGHSVQAFGAQGKPCGDSLPTSEDRVNSRSAFPG